MKLAVIASLVASAAAFAPAKTSTASTALNMAFEDELGAQPPLGCFDPLGMLNDADQERFDRLRYVEIKHGRICQLGFLGQIITRAGIHLPGKFNSFAWRLSSSEERSCDFTYARMTFSFLTTECSLSRTIYLYSL
jgi:hypothetical protein